MQGAERKALSPKGQLLAKTREIEEGWTTTRNDALEYANEEIQNIDPDSYVKRSGSEYVISKIPAGYIRSGY